MLGDKGVIGSRNGGSKDSGDKGVVECSAKGLE
jgi:hypothetical protein